MALTIINGGDLPPTFSELEEGLVKPEQVEVFGRLRLTREQIAKWYGVTTNSIETLFRRSEIRAAYDRGRAQTIVALRQKQLQLALGGDVRMLLYTGDQFADQTRGGSQLEVEDFEPSRFSWDGEMKKRLDAARDELLKGAGGPGGA